MTKQSKNFANLQYLLIVLSLVAALGLWNGFAKEGAADTEEQSASTTNGVALPTLIPISDIALPDKPKQATSPEQEQSDQPLREVSQPETAIVQKKHPVVEQVSLGNAAPSADDAGNGSSPAAPAAPVTSTSSS